MREQQVKAQHVGFVLMTRAIEEDSNWQKEGI